MTIVNWKWSAGKLYYFSTSLNQTFVVLDGWRKQLKEKKNNFKKKYFAYVDNFQNSFNILSWMLKMLKEFWKLSTYVKKFFNGNDAK